MNTVAYDQSALDDAKTQPRYRTPDQQANVDKNLGDLTIKNADFEARRLQGIG